MVWDAEGQGNEKREELCCNVLSEEEMGRTANMLAWEL
jgi:hypothetical protein